MPDALRIAFLFIGAALIILAVLYPRGRAIDPPPRVIHLPEGAVGQNTITFFGNGGAPIVVLHMDELFSTTRTK